MSVESIYEDEQWSIIPEFPNYVVSDHGEIINRVIRKPVRTSSTNYGNLKVALCKEGMRCTRSVARLVAEAFVDPPDEMSNEVVMLDGNHLNAWAYNLVWRPRHFAWKYTRQLKIDQPPHYWNLSVQENVTGAVYPCVMEAAMSEGLLVEDIWRSTYLGTEVYPTQSVFEIVDRV